MESDNIYTVYETTNLLNGKTYIGAHRENGRTYFGSGCYILKALSKYGKRNFKKVVLFRYDNPEDMFTKEAELVDETYVKRWDTYNTSLGGKGCKIYGPKHTESYKKKMSDLHTGKVLSDETKDKLRKFNLGRKQSKSQIERKSKKIFIDNVEYTSVEECSRQTLVPPTTIRRRAVSDKFPNYSYSS